MDVLLTLPDVTAMWTFWSEFILKKNLRLKCISNKTCSLLRLSSDSLWWLCSGLDGVKQLSRCVTRCSRMARHISLLICYCSMCGSWSCLGPVTDARMPYRIKVLKRITRFNGEMSHDFGISATTLTPCDISLRRTNLMFGCWRHLSQTIVCGALFDVVVFSCSLLTTARLHLLCVTALL